MLTNDGFHCDVIAPSLVPRQLGERRKTHRLDAIMVARLYRSRHLTAIQVPDQDQEAVPHLLRIRTKYQISMKANKNGISGILGNPSFAHHLDRSTWTKKIKLRLDKLRTTLTGPLQTALAIKLEHFDPTNTSAKLLTPNWNATPFWNPKEQRSKHYVAFEVLSS